MSQAHLLPLVSTLATTVIPKLVRELGHTAVEGSTDTSDDGFKLVSRCQHSPIEKLSKEGLWAQAESCLKACLELNSAELHAYILDLLSNGLDMEELYLDIFPLAIGMLHDHWEEDQVSFLDITRVTWSIKRLLFVLSPEFIKPNETSWVPQMNRFQVLVCVAPNAQHTIGPLLVSQYLQRKGWLILPGIDHSENEILELVSKNWVDLFCVSISLKSEIPRLKTWIEKVRFQSKNKDIQCVVGGSLLAFEPQLELQLGADVACNNPRDLHTLGMKLVKVHRKVRKLSLQSVEELSRVQRPQGQSLIKAHIADLSSKPGLSVAKSPSTINKMKYSDVERSTLESFNTESLIGRSRRKSGLNV